MSAAQHAVECLLWSSDTYAAYPAEDLVELVTKEWEDFRERAEAMGFDAVEHRLLMIDPTQGDEWAAAAHDFIMTRNGHGTGFWEAGRWHAPWNQKLTALAKEYGPLDVWIDDENEAHLLF